MAGILSKLSKSGDVSVVGVVVLILAMLIVPLPSFLLDFFLSINICVAFAILLLTMHVQRSLEFSVFPSLLLLTTLFRLSLNVSSTKLILLDADAGSVIDAFGRVVARDNYIVGFVMFIILTIIQFMVITKGSERVAEVAARFTLDAMPGKQMSIDADLNAGIITENEARTRRRNVEREADFYGAMDGASKFVKGDAIAGLLITAINLIGGFVIGAVQRGYDLMQALQTYALLTIGDGLVSQIPALLISTATGILVTRSASEDSLGNDLAKQLLAYPKIFAIVGGALAFFGIIPGMPKIPFFAMAILSVLLAHILKQNISRETAEALQKSVKEKAEQPQQEAKKPENVAALLQIEPMELEIGYRLIPLVDPSQGGDLFDRVTLIRRQTAMEMGMVLPPIRIRDNMQLPPTNYVIKIKGIDVSRGEIIPTYYLAMDPGIATKKIDGIATVEPAFGLPALWISENQRDEAELAGYTVVDAPSILATHLTEVIKSNAYELLGRQEVQGLIDNIKEEYSVVVSELIPGLMNIGEIQKVLIALLKEGIPIRNMVTILETLADYAHMTKDTDVLTEFVRQALARQITKMVQTDDGTIKVITLDPRLEQILIKVQEEAKNSAEYSMNPQLVQGIYTKLRELIKQVTASGNQPIILCSPTIRLTFRRIVERMSSKLMVLSYNELLPEAEIHSIGVVNLVNEG